jgi:DNA-binding CsgD family transcriptional regulator
VTVVVGVDGAGRTFRLGRLVDAAGTRAWWVGTGDLAAGLAAARDAGTVVVADDAHRLAPEVLRALAAAARSGVRVLVARRPTIDSAELADLDEAVAAGGVEWLGPLDRDEIGTLVAVATGRPASPEVAAAVHELSAGLPGVAAAVAAAGLPVVAASSAGLSGTAASAGSSGVAGAGPSGVAAAPASAGLSGVAGAVASGGLPGAASAGLSGAARASAGLPGVAASASSGVAGPVASVGLSGLAAASAVSGAPVPALLARVQRRFAVLSRQVGAVARVLALRLELSDDVLAAAATVPADELSGVLRTLRDEGMLVPGGERMIPAMADAVLGELSAAERRRLHDVVAGALAAAGADPLVTAAQLRAARVRTPAAAEIYRQAGELIRFADPSAALAWFDDATDAGADPAAVAAGRAEAGALLGLPPDADLLADSDARLMRLAGASAAHDGRADRAAELLLAAGAPLLAVPVLVGTGRLAEAREATHDQNGTPAATRFAEAVLAAVHDPDAAVPLLIEAAEVAERATPVAVLPDTPHAVGAVVAVLAGDVAAAEYLLDRAGRAGIGGPAAAERHRLLLAWARMRAGRYDTALAELARPVGELPARERLLRASIAAGMARRRGDIAGLRAVWGGVEPVLARRAVDLWQLEPVEELLVAAARLRHDRRVEPILAALETTVARLGGAPAWAAALGWLRVQVAVAADDPETATTQARRLTEIGIKQAGHRASAQCAAAGLWARLLAGTPAPPEDVLAASEQLVVAQLPWEASRLAGQAAIHATDPVVVRRLLERARELSEPDAPTAGATQAGGLSERELAVAKLVLAGSTHREIGAQLYIAPKTVEHHVARIRTKLGAGSRAELLATLREILADQK